MRPGLDDKRLAAWNALMIAALADAGAVLGREDYLDAARAAAAFVLDADARRPTAACCAPSTPATARLGAYLEDHAFLLEALLVLYEATFEERWFVEARALADTIVARFADPERGGFFSTADDHEALIARRKDLEDSPIPSGGSSAALGLLRLAALTGEHAYEEQARRPAARCCTRSPSRHPTRLRAPAAGARPLPRAAARGRPGRRPGGRRGAGAPSCARRAGRTSCSPAGRATGRPRWRSWSSRTPVDGRAAAYVCERFACRTPVTEPDELRALL